MITNSYDNAEIEIFNAELRDKLDKFTLAASGCTDTIMALRQFFIGLVPIFQETCKSIVKAWNVVPPEVKAVAFIDTIGGFDGSQAQNLRRWKRNCRKRGYDRRIYKAGCRILRGGR